MICGRKNGQTFKTATRPDYTSGDCPAGMTKCGSATMAIDNVMCAKSADECPITFVGFFATAQLNNNNFPPADYDRQPFNAQITLLTSKTYNALPVTTFVYENQPCMINKVSPSSAHYLLEKNQALACPREPITGLYYDPRFYQTGGLSTAESVMLTENLVLPKMIDDAPGINKDQNIPSTNVFSMQIFPWSRSTVPWALRCEAEVTHNKKDMSRDLAHDMFALRLDSDFHAKKA